MDTSNPKIQIIPCLENKLRPMRSNNILYKDMIISNTSILFPNNNSSHKFEVIKT